MIYSTPYRRIPNLVIAQLFMGSVKWINALLSETGVSGTLRPQATIEGSLSPVCINQTLDMVLYVNLYNVTTNIQNSRIVGAIALII